MAIHADRLTIRQLKLILAIYREGNLVRAAQSVHMTQSAVTKALREAEALCGVSLFNRTNRGVTPTLYGEAIVHHGRRILSELEAASAELDDLKHGNGGRIAIGTLLAAAADILPTTIALLRQRRPNIRVKVLEGTNNQLMPALRAGELDMVIGRLPEFRSRHGMRQEYLMDDSARIIVRKGHPLTQYGALQLANLLKWPWILPGIETTLRRQIDDIFRDEGYEPPTNVVESVSLLTNRYLLTSGDYIGIWPDQVAKLEKQNGLIDILPLDLAHLNRPIGITTLIDGRETPASQMFLKILREEVIKYQNT
ncbi:LysR family transcriptional regulator [Bartonella sp. HY329]|uniref:LysR family transcriptional regulator n=1 Tax=unclassified Bartonella TaxID=2645622 RepID=UPI0021CA8FBB|nr:MULTISPECIES: LysR family transcriptional regulator [unclassified Bartonella]UXM95078.1 LysR family transcriptional regulator [Bartonella sp. HY329]UXN09401.1 LysR family transcriptional regulator [Bartonella sp. HY328]